MKRPDCSRQLRPLASLARAAVVVATLVTPQLAKCELVLHVDFENGSDLARDVSSTGASGVISQIVDTGASPAGVLVQTGDAAVGSGAALFNPADSGTNGFAIEFPDAQLPDLGAADNFAISYWVKPTTAYLNYNPNHAMFSSVATGADATLSFQIENKGNVTDGQVGVARFSGPFFETPLIDETTNLTPGVWQNVAAVSNGQNGRIQVFVDGQLTQEVETEAIVGFKTGLALNEVYLGMNRGRSKLFQGLMDDVRLYDTAAVSELLEITGSSIPRLVIDRDTGSASITIPGSGTTEEIVSYTITSAVGVLDPAQWQPISGGAGTEDALSESFVATTINPGTPIDLGPVWRKGPFEDLYATALLSDGTTTLPLPIAYEGNGGDAFAFGDLSGVGDGIDLDDWLQFKSGQGADMSALSRIDAYLLGDLDGDGDNDGIDFFLFEEAFDAANSPGAFRAMLAAPEPSALVGGLGLTVAFALRRRRVTLLLVGSVLATSAVRPATAQLLVYDGFDTATLPSASALNGTPGGQSSFGWDSNTWTDTIGRNEQPFISQTEGLAAFPGLKSSQGYATRPAKNGRTALNREIGASELETITAEGSEFWFSLVIANRTTPDDHDEAVFLFAETPLVDFRDIDFATGFVSSGGGPVPVSPFRSIGIMFDDGPSSGSLGTNVGGRDGDAIYAIYTDASGLNAVYSDGEFAIGNANEPHLVVGHVTWGADGGDHQYDLYAMGIEDIVDPIAPLELPAAPFGSLTIPADAVIPADLNTIGLAGTKLPAYDEMRFGLTAEDVIPSIERLTLEVDIATGAVTLKNETAESFEIDYIEIKSDAGSLNPASWVSLSDNPSFPSGDDDGTGWEEGPNNNATQLIESYLLGATTIGPNDEVALGQVFSPQAAQDLTLAYHLESSGAVVDGGRVEYVGDAGVVGNYNGDNTVDASDYAFWRETLNTSVSPGSGADGNGDGIVNVADLDVWRNAYGAGSATASVATPEPTGAGAGGCQHGVAYDATPAFVRPAPWLQLDAASRKTRRLQHVSRRSTNARISYGPTAIGSAARAPRPRLHIGRAAGCDCDYRGPYRSAPPCCSGGPRSRPSDAVPEQSEEHLTRRA